jgi:hypothetical protein
MDPIASFEQADGDLNQYVSGFEFAHTPIVAQMIGQAAVGPDHDDALLAGNAVNAAVDYWYDVAGS